MSLYSYDSTIIVGKAGKDAEMKYLNNGNPVTSFSVAVDRSYKPKDGDLVKRTIWYRVQVFGKFAEVCKDISKGDTIMVIGNLDADWTTGSPRIWNKKDGTAGASFELTASEVKFLSPKQGHAAQPEEDNPF
jgi:single-strand DNA-binding protein